MIILKEVIILNQQEIKKAWEKYVLNKEEIPLYVSGVRDEILNSWRRCQKKLDPHMNITRSLPSEEMQVILDKNKLLIDVAYPYLLDFYDDLAEQHFMIMLTDNNGCMLKSIGHTNMLNQLMEENHFFDGYFFGEEDAGTGGVGLCLAERKPVVVFGYEHYNQNYHNLVCYGAPLQDLEGEVIGSISITGLIDYYQPTIMGMVKAAKKGIEKEFTLKRMNNILTSTISSVNSGIIVLDVNNQILYHNKTALDLLHISKDSITNKNIKDFLSEECLCFFNTEINDIECTLMNYQNQLLELCLSVKYNLDTDSLTTKTVIFESQEEKHRFASLMAGFKARYTFNDIKGITPMIENVKQIGKYAASMDTPLLIYGEKGTEIDLLSEAIHNSSLRANNPFITIDCTSASKQSLTNDLFGNKNQIGKLELANNGTLFFYEIGQLPLDFQEKLYQFLNNKQLQKENSKYPKSINVRIIAYSSTNLLDQQFHKQLYFLLTAMTLTIPPLRERKEDISVLVKMLGRRIYEEDLFFDEDSMNALISYHWPGNVKQLYNVIESAVYSTKNKVIQLSNLPVDIVNDYYSKNNITKTLESFNKERNDAHLSKEMQEYNELLFAIKETEGNVKKAAHLLYIPSSTLYRKLRYYKINPKEYKK